MITILQLLFAVVTAVQTPVRDAGATVTALGTGVLQGRVVFAEEPSRGVRRAIVTLTAAELTPSRSTITDDDGRFAFSNLPAGRFTVSARRAAFLTATYGTRVIGAPAVPIALAAGQRVSDITLLLARGAAIAGSIRDQAGDPAGGINVFVVPASALGSHSAIPPSAVTVTNDRGSYRLFGLEPGEYVVMAFVRSSDAGDIAVATVSNVDAMLAALERGSLRPETSFMPTAGQRPVDGSAAPPAATHTFAPVYFPGTASPGEAARIILATGDDRTGVDFTLSPTPVAAIDGELVGAPQNADVALMIMSDGPKMQSWITPQASLAKSPGADGRFRYASVAPGHYTIMARTQLSRLSGGQGVPSFLGTSEQTLWAQADVTVNGTDVSNVALVFQPTMRLSGRVQIDDASSPRPVDLTKVRVQLTSVLGPIFVTSGQGGGTLTVPSVNARADGTFDVAGVIPGEYKLICAVSGSPEWFATSAIVDGRDLLDVPVRFEPGGSSVSGLVMTLSTRHSELSGQLHVPAGTSAADYAVVAFPAARELWTPHSRRIVVARPATDGQFVIKDLPAGVYALAALMGVTGDDAETLSLLEQALPGSVKLSLQAGERRTQDITVVR